MYEKDEIDTTSKKNIRDNGEVFTPFAIVEKMLDLIPEKAWKDPEFIFLEPTCGNGQFLVKVLERRLKHGLSIEVALNTLIGMEINPSTLLDSHTRLYKIVVDQMKKEGVIPYKRVWFERAIKIVAIVHNNIFKVKDSLVYMEKKIKDKKFFSEDPTGNGWVLSEKEQNSHLDKIKVGFREHKDGKPSKTLGVFFKEV